MTAEIMSSLVQARDQLLRDGKDAESQGFEKVATLVSNAGLALDDVVLLIGGGTKDFEFGLRRAAHRAMGQLEMLSTSSESFHFPRAYQVLLDIAYA